MVRRRSDVKGGAGIPLQSSPLPVNDFLQEIYKFDPNDMVPDITVSRYSNLAYVQITPRDIYIDFLEMPGLKKEGKMHINGVRIYMSHMAAKRLATVLNGIIAQAQDKGVLERLGETPKIPTIEKKK